LNPANSLVASSTRRLRIASSVRLAHGPAAIAVGEGRHALGPVPMRQPVDLAGREAQDGRRLGHCHLTGQQMGKDVGALLSLAVQADRLPRFHGIESDKLAVPLARTDSLSSDRL
jgi:hypothetical protein